MADTSNSSSQSTGFTDKLKSWLSWSWTYIWAIWFAMVLVLIYVLRSPLKLQETLATASVFLNTLTPKFYVALTGTSSLISGLILIFEWWYFRKYGTSFIEQVSVSHLRPLLGGVENSSSAGLFSSANGDAEPRPRKEPLTYYDMNLSAQDHQTFFTCDTQQLRPEDAGRRTANGIVGSSTAPNPISHLSELVGGGGIWPHKVMQKAWRERNPQARIKAAYQAIELNNECATAYVLLAEEEATTITEAERLFRQALRSAGKDTNVLVYIKRRLAMCARKLGRIKEAVKMMRDLMKEFPLLGMLNIHENLLEALLEMQAYADVQAVLAKYDDISLPKSATICYTSALLKARAVSDKFSPEAASRRGLSTAEMNAVEAIHRAVEFNPHVPKYLLEMKSLILPPEHILKRGDTFRMIPYPLEKGHLFYPYPGCTESADRELLPSFHEVSVYPKKELPFFILFTAGLCSFTAMLAMLTHQFPELMGVFAKAVSTCLSVRCCPLLVWRPPAGANQDLSLESRLQKCLCHQCYVLGLVPSLSHTHCCKLEATLNRSWQWCSRDSESGPWDIQTLTHGALHPCTSAGINPMSAVDTPAQGAVLQCALLGQALLSVRAGSEGEHCLLSLSESPDPEGRRRSALTATDTVIMSEVSGPAAVSSPCRPRASQEADCVWGSMASLPFISQFVSESAAPNVQKRLHCLGKHSDRTVLGGFLSRAVGAGSCGARVGGFWVPCFQGHVICGQGPPLRRGTRMKDRQSSDRGARGPGVQA
ncbi:hypothetical protein JZ751_024079 [Albula glossodonta]|uniref:Suppressor of tumorigenicity 7 protein-like n=1 Tax=Albula glossodonta TaxID=121402 RepID=A0A8T2MQ39_9TELE|nr:hypothetical protein JZ751_024079 [Albula glossodonta]